MTCELCGKPIQCAGCDGTGEIEAKDIDGEVTKVICPACNNLHAACFLIKLDKMIAWEAKKKQLHS